MSDHLNISYPKRRSDLDDRLALARLQAEYEVLQAAHDKLQADLQSIFTRIDRGEQCELHYPDGRIVPITKARKRGPGDSGEAA